MELLWPIIVFALTTMGGFALLIFRTGKWVKRIDMEIFALKEQQTTVHDGCHIKVGDMKKVQRDIEGLKDKDHKLDIDLVAIQATLESVKIMSTDMHDFFLNRGMEAKNI